MPHDYYKILGISHAADLQKIQQATQTRANEIKTAFAVLSQADTRTAYDAKLDQGPHNHYATLAVSREANLAQIKVAAQARMKEIKEAFENLSKPDTRAAYDSQWQPVKPTSSVTPPKPPRLENLSPPATRAAADSHWPPVKPSTPVAPEIELADRGTRLKAVIYDVLIIGVILVLASMFATDHLTKQFVPTASSFLVPVIGVIMTNLVLLYYHGQTLGKYICSIKMVNADGSRAGLGILLVRTVVAVSIIPLLAAILFLKGLAPPIIGTLIAIALLMDSLLIFQNSRRCWHDMITKTIVVKVFPGMENEAPEIELVERGTRLKAVIYDVLIIGVILVLASMFATDHLTKQFVPTASSFLVPVIGVIMTNLVLLYRHGQTLGKHICSIKIVNTDGSRAGLGILLVRTVVAVSIIPLLAAILFLKGLAPPIIGTLIAIALLMDSLLIFQNSRRCWHDMITKTIVVKVFPGEAAAPVLIERQKDSVYNVAYSFMQIIARVGLFFIPFGALILKWDEQHPVDIEIPPAARVRQGPPASKGILLLLTLFLGWMGAHHFYLGRYTRGTMYLLFFWTWIPGLFAVIEFLAFLDTSSDSIGNDYTANNSEVAFVFIPVFITFIGLFVLAQWIAYTDDLKLGIERNKVSEAVQLLNGLKTPAEQYMAAKGQFPSMIGEVTKTTSGNDIATLTSNPDEFYFEATMNQQDSVLVDKVVRLIFHRDTKTWRCRTPSSNGIPPEYLPTGCNSSTVEIIANSDDWKREKVSKAIQLLEELKQPAEQYMAVKGEFPPTITLLTNRTSGKYTANLVSNPEHFYLEATMSKEDTVLGGKSVWVIYHPDTKTWGCSAAYLNGIAQKYLPSVCQSSPAEITANLNSWRREEASEAIQLLEELKTPTEQYITAKGEFPPTIDVVTKKTAGKYTASIIPNPKEFYLEATMNKEDSVMAGKVVRLNYYPNTKLWSCSAAYPKGIPQQYLPKVCQSSDAEIIAIINPAMRDELSRSKVSEAILLLEALKQPVEQYMAEEGKFPPAIELLSLLLSDTVKSSIKYTASIIPNPKEFYLEATLKKEGSVLAGQTVRLIYQPNTKIWSYSATSPNGIPLKYLPSVDKSPFAKVPNAKVPVAHPKVPNAPPVMPGRNIFKCILRKGRC